MRSSSGGFTTYGKHAAILSVLGRARATPTHLMSRVFLSQGTAYELRVIPLLIPCGGDFNRGLVVNETRKHGEVLTQICPSTFLPGPYAPAIYAVYRTLQF